MITVYDTMQQGYQYRLIEPVGENFHPDFKPQLTPKQMLALGVFGGCYMTDCQQEFPKDWFTHAKLSARKPNHALNYFGVRASQPLQTWRDKGWINERHDPRGWFQWYCRYTMGRRLPEEDERQIKRWRAIRRHVAQIQNHCKTCDLTCRPRQRQVLLHWAYDARRI
ncbi:MAG: hypothetical protein AAF320_05390 [Myxococcota bacterium]